MENWQKIVLVLIIFIFIIVLDLFLYFKTEKLINNSQNSLGVLEEKIDKGKLERDKKGLKQLDDKWGQYEKTLSFFIEHDELEKVSSKIAIIGENIENEEYESALEDIVEAKYILNHIKDKYNFSLKNIF